MSPPLRLSGSSGPEVVSFPLGPSTATWTSEKLWFPVRDREKPVATVATPVFWAPLRSWDRDMTASNAEASWRLAIALVQELTTHWRAEIREYGVSSSGGLVFDLVLKPASAECLVARSRILKERNRRTVSETADVKNFIVFRPGSRSNGCQLSALTAARDDERD